MKKLLFSICLMAMAFSLNAQENQNLKGEIGLQVAGSAAVKPVQTYGISVQPYYKLTPKLSLGLGTGLIYTDHLGIDQLNHYSVPLYADLKYAFIKRKVTPYIEMQRGINFGFPGYKEYTYSNFGINYGSILLGVSVARSDISIGLMSYDYSQHGEHERYGGWVVHYAYNFKLSDKHVKEQAEKEYDTEGALNGRFNLLTSGQVGLLTPLFALLDFTIPYNMSAGLMAEYRIDKTFSVGIGADVNAAACIELLGMNRDEDKQRFCSLPVYADFRATFGKDEVRPFVDFKGGYAFALNTLRIHESSGLIFVTETARGEAQTKGLYGTAAVGVSVGHSDYSLGLCSISYQGTLGNKDFEEFDTHLFFRYSYRFGLAD